MTVDMQEEFEQVIRDPQRLSALRRTGLLDTSAEEPYDRLTRLAARLLDAPIALVSLLDRDHHLIKSHFGLSGLWASQSEWSLAESFCHYPAVLKTPLVVGETLEHPLFKDHPAIAEYGVRAYLGIQLITSDGFGIGTFCVLDMKPRTWTETHIQNLKDLAVAVETDIELRTEITEQRRTERTLREREDQYKLAVETAKLGSWELDGNLDFLALSDTCKAHFGLPPDARVSYEDLFEIIHPDDAEYVRQRVARATDEGLEYDVEFRVIWPDRSTHWIGARGRTIDATENSPLRLVGTSLDITERKQAEEDVMEHVRLMALSADIGTALTKSESLSESLRNCARAVSHHLDAALVRIWTLNERENVLELQSSAGMYTRLNDPYRVIPVGQLKVGKIAEERKPEFTNSVIDDPNATDHDWIEREGIVSFAGCPLIVGNQLVGVMAMFARYPLTDYALRALISIADEVAVGVQNQQFQAAQREEARIIETLHQIGATLSAELDLETLLQAVTDAATDLSGAEFGAFFYNVVSEDGEAYQLYTLSGAPSEAFERFPNPRSTEIFGPTFRGEEIIRLDDVTQDPRFGNNPPYYGMPEGHLPVCSYLAVPVVSRSGEIFGGLFFGHSQPRVFQERHERLVAGIASHAAIGVDNAQLYQQAQKALKAREDFLSIASHELKTPLTSIMGYAQMALRQLGLSDLDRGRLEQIAEQLVEQTERMHLLVNDLLDVSRIQRGQLDLRPEETDLTALAQQIIQRYTNAPELTDEHVLTLNAPKSVVGVWDPFRLEQLLTNLLSNAIKYSPEGGEVRVTVCATDGRAEILVRDEGIGISPELQERLFEPFARGEARAGNMSGTGLGLYITRQIVERHGGMITVKSEPGAETTFTVTLPLSVPGYEDEQASTLA